MELTAAVCKAIRKAAGLSGTPYPIKIVEGDTPPTLKGRTYHWTTKTGIPIRYPNAYARYGRPVYHASTRRIEVGRDFVAYIAAALAVV